MESNNRNKVMVDLVQLDEEVRAKAAEYLDDITEESLKAFAESTKLIAQALLEKFYFSVDDLYTEGALKLEDENQFNAFFDFHDGYRAKMRLWANQNQISIREMKIDAPTEFPKKERGTTRTPVAIAGFGTLIAAGLVISGVNVWLIVAAELLALASAAYLYKKRAKSEADYAFRVEQYTMQVEKEKARLVNGLIEDLKAWLNDAEAHSDSLLATFGIK